MYHVDNLTTQKSYATEATALKALEKEFGPANAGERLFNVILARNPAGRVVIVAINVREGWLGRLCHSKSIGVVCN